MAFRDSTVAGGDTLITCGQCFSILAEPVSLPCHHSFCLRCVRGKLDRAGAGEGVVCVVCNAVHPAVSFRGIQDMVDMELANKITLLNKGTDGRIICQWCEEASATLHCPDCQYVLCSDCNMAVHKNAAKRNHQPTTLGDNRMVKTMSKKCTVKGHEEYRLEFYCLRCEQLCCAYCLQIGPHRAHDNVLVSKAAQDARHQMGRDLEVLSQLKARIDTQASELNRIHTQYMDSYDHVESLLTDRFNAFRQQLAAKELEVRKILSSLREAGDQTLSNSREQFLRKLNSINAASLNFRRLQNGGADYEVLQNRAAMSLFVRMEVPTVHGTGFRLSDLGDLNLAGLNLGLDLNEHSGGGSAPVHPSGAPGAGGAPGAVGGGGSRSGTPVQQGSESVSVQQRRIAGSFTFEGNHDVETRNINDGILFRCSENPEQEQIGIRANETFEMLKNTQMTDQGVVSWRYRLDMLNKTYIGIADHAEDSDDTQGFYWCPMRQSTFDITLGRPTHASRSLPVCRNGDVVKFSYDVNAKVLKLAINGADRGIICTDMHSHVSPCIVFGPGEALTFLI